MNHETLRAGRATMPKSALMGVSFGGLAAAFLASLCCVGPLLFVSLGVGAGLAGTFEPLRPLFGILMLAFLSTGFWTVYGKRTGLPHDLGGDTAPGASDGLSMPTVACAAPTRRRRDVVVLWSATVLAVVLWSFPTWSLWLL